MDLDILRGVEKPFSQCECIIRQTYIAPCCDRKTDKVFAICSEGPEFNSPRELVHGAGRRGGIHLGNCLSLKKKIFYIIFF